MLFPHRYNVVRFVNPDKADRFVIWLSHSCNSVRLVKPVSAEISDTELSPRSSVVRFVAVSSPVKLVIRASCTLSEVNFAISAAVIGSPGVLPSAVSILARRFASGMLTPVSCLATSVTLGLITSSGRSGDLTRA